MKTLTTLLAVFFLTSFCSAQTLDKIKTKYYSDNWVEKLENAETIFAHLSFMMNDESTYVQTLKIKKPDKYKMMIYSECLLSFNSSDGKKDYLYFLEEGGYFMSNVQVGTADPESYSEAISNLEIIEFMLSSVNEIFETGGFELNNEKMSNIDGKPAYKLAGIIEEEDLKLNLIVYFDQMSYQLVEISGTIVGEGGGVITLHKIEIDIDMYDSDFSIEL